MLGWSRPALNSWWHRLSLIWQARTDGRKGIPAPGHTSDAESQLIEQGKRAMLTLQRKYEPKLAKLESEREKAVKHFTVLLARYLEELGRYNQKRQELNRHVVVVHIRRGWYALLLVVIGVGEAFLNAQAFQIFQSPQLDTLLMALSVGVAVPGLAHFVGIWVKQWPRPAWVTALKVAIVTAVVIGGLYAVNFVRMSYLRQLDLLPPGGEVLQVPLFAINLLAFVAAVVVSYFAHDVDQELDLLHRRVSRLDRKLDAVDARIHDLDGEINALKTTEENELQLVCHAVRELIHLYRRYNLLARKEAGKVFGAEPNLQPPPVQSALQNVTPPEQVEELRKRRLHGGARLQPVAEQQPA